MFVREYFFVNGGAVFLHYYILQDLKTGREADKKKK